MAPDCTRVRLLYKAVERYRRVSIQCGKVWKKPVCLSGDLGEVSEHRGQLNYSTPCFLFSPFTSLTSQAFPSRPFCFHVVPHRLTLSLFFCNRHTIIQNIGLGTKKLFIACKLALLESLKLESLGWWCSYRQCTRGSAHAARGPSCARADAPVSFAAPSSAYGPACDSTRRARCSRTLSMKAHAYLALGREMMVSWACAPSVRYKRVR